jgi:AraC-like DNA-binding protein
MKFLLYFEPVILSRFGSESDPVGKSKRAAGGQPEKSPIQSLPIWADWLWEHKHGQPLNASELWQPLGSRAKPDHNESDLPPAIPRVIFLERPYGKSFEDQPPWPNDWELTDYCLVLILQTQSSKNHLTLLRGNKRREWDGFPDSADVLKALKAELHLAAESAHDGRRQARHRLHKEKEAMMAHSFVQLVEQHYRDNQCTIPHLARLMKISGTKLQQICQKQFAMSPKAYLIQVRVRKSCELICKVPEQRRCVMSKIARDSGFSSSSYFSFIFLNIMGRTPTEYRHQQIQQKSRLE